MNHANPQAIDTQANPSVPRPDHVEKGSAGQRSGQYRAGMQEDRLEYEGKLHAIQAHAVPDDAWYIELSEAAPAPTSWANLPGADQI